MSSNYVPMRLRHGALAAAGIMLAFVAGSAAPESPRNVAPAVALSVTSPATAAAQAPAAQPPAARRAPLSSAPLSSAPLTDATTPSAPPSLAASASGAPRQFTVLGAGDILLHSGLWAQARKDAAAAGKSGYYFDPLFASAAPDISGASLAICHMETPYGKAGGPFHSYPVFQVPPAIAQTIHDIGYDSCSTASNHSIDAGEAGVDRTLDALDKAGVKHAGTARTPTEAATPDLLNAGGVTVAQLSYAYGFNGLKRPAGKNWLANLIDVPKILADAKAARAAGAQVVIVSLHFGTEYQSAPNDQQRSVAKALLGSPDVDLILGCHAHVVQPFEQINGKWVAYGMGNQVATQPFSKPTQDGVMPRFTFTETSPGKFTVTKAEAIPTFMYLGQQGGPDRLIDLPRELAKPGLSSARKALYQASWDRTEKIVTSRGAAKDGLMVVNVGDG
jgi:poly-gamma-glutamate capsule biosynthesis protein CapA/YwtB (metallophosphatase superfamily)